MLQTVLTEEGKSLLLFFDSGCSRAAMTESAAEILGTQCVRPGPTRVDTCGGKHIDLKSGDERLCPNSCKLVFSWFSL